MAERRRHVEARQLGEKGTGRAGSTAGSVSYVGTYACMDCGWHNPSVSCIRVAVFGDMNVALEVWEGSWAEPVLNLRWRGMGYHSDRGNVG